jgi:hypothetical protein
MVVGYHQKYSGSDTLGEMFVGGKSWKVVRTPDA